MLNTIFVSQGSQTLIAIIYSNNHRKLVKI